MSASFSYFVYAAPMHEVSCVGYTPRTWDPRSLLSMLNGLLYFGLLQRLCSDYLLYFFLPRILITIFIFIIYYLLYLLEISSDTNLNSPVNPM